MNTRRDEADPDAFWYDAAPLQNKDLTISVEHQLLEIEGMGKLLTMEVQFRRKKGEYFSIYNFGTCITPDSDELERGSHAAVAGCDSGIFVRATSTLINAEEASAMRAAVAHPDGFPQALTSSRRASGALLRSSSSSSSRRVALMGGLWTRRPSQGPFFQWWLSVVSFDSIAGRFLRYLRVTGKENSAKRSAQRPHTDDTREF